MDQPLMRLEHIEFGYHASWLILKDLCLEISSNDRLLLQGDNGSGKTTILHILTGLIQPQKGSVWAFGRERHGESDFQEVRPRAGLLFQDADDQLFCPTVSEDVAFGPLNMGKSPTEAEEIVASTLAELGIEPLQDRLTYELSGGEKRLVALAGVLAMNLEVLLLDEPTAGLDREAKKRLCQILAELDHSLLVVSHDESLSEALKLKHLRLESGRIINL